MPNFTGEAEPVVQLAERGASDIDFSSKLSDFTGLQQQLSQFPGRYCTTRHTYACFFFLQKLQTLLSSAYDTFLVTLAFFKLMCFSAVLIYC